MARVSVNFSISSEDRKELTRVIEEKLLRRARNNFGDFRIFIKDAINDGIDEVKDEFIPTDREAEELGVGEGGEINRDKTESAYKQLYPGDDAGASKFSVRKLRRSSDIGRVKFELDEKTFYNAPLSIVNTPDSQQIDQIPWMLWLIEGAANSSYRFISRRNAKNSRTGGGIMVEGGLWTFVPNDRAFIRLEDSVRAAIIDELRRRASEVL